MSEVIENASTLDSRAEAAKQSKDEMERLIEEFRPFLHARVSRYALRSEPDQREEMYSAALIAFYEAIQNYDIEKGHFFTFANRVVCERIIDYIRGIYRQKGRTVSLDEQDEDQRSTQSAAIIELSVRSYDTQRKQEQLVDEIEQFKSELTTWGITMDSLTKQSPKHQKLREAYRKAVADLSQSTDIVQTIQLKRYFPIKAASEITGLPQKKLERARTFILASLIIRLGDYSCLSDYVSDR
jgi:RNA polymerase sigma factor